MKTHPHTHTYSIYKLFRSFNPTNIFELCEKKRKHNDKSVFQPSVLNFTPSNLRRNKSLVFLHGHFPFRWFRFSFRWTVRFYVRQFSKLPPPKSELIYRWSNWPSDKEKKKCPNKIFLKSHKQTETTAIYYKVVLGHFLVMVE